MARQCDLAIVSASTHPFSRWDQQRRTEDSAGRYSGLEGILQDVIREILIDGLHIHVSITDEARRIAAMNQVRAFLPHILALLANSPFWMGHSTGYQSFRTMVWAPFPLAGVPDAFASVEEYRAFHTLLESTGALSTPRRIWWDVRAHAVFPTLEFRIADMPASHADTVAIAAFIQALCRALLERHDRGDPLPSVPTPIVNENKWRAARYGLCGTLIDYARGEAVPTREALAEAFDLVAESMDLLGTTDQLAHLHGMLEPEYRTGAERQLEAFERRGDLLDVVALLRRETVRGIALADALPLAALPDGTPTGVYCPLALPVLNSRAFVESDEQG
jgi:glutamate---cysteine ligase / carboxylate-amine ligase